MCHPAVPNKIVQSRCGHPAVVFFCQPHNHWSSANPQNDRAPNLAKLCLVMLTASGNQVEGLKFHSQGSEKLHLKQLFQNGNNLSHG